MDAIWWRRVLVDMTEPSRVIANVILVSLGITGCLVFSHLWLWRRHQHQSKHLWASLWCTSALAFLLGRYLQYTGSTIDTAAIGSKIQYAAGFAIILFTFGYATSFSDSPPSRRVWRVFGTITFILAVVAFIIAFGSSAGRHVTDLFGSRYYMVDFGLALPVLIIYQAAVIAYCAMIIWRSRQIAGLIRLKWIVLLTLCFVSGANDVAMTAGWISSFQTFEHAIAITAVGISYHLLYEYGQMYANLEESMQERTLQLETMVEDARVSEQRFRELAELLPGGVYEMDLTGRLTYVNRGLCEILGYTRDELIGVMEFATLLPEDEQQRAREAMSTLIGGEGLQGNEYRVVRKDGRPITFITYTNPVLRDGKVSGLRGIIIDITDRKFLEEQLRQTSKMEAIGQLAGGVAHDFNNLLAAIMHYAQNLQLEQGATETVKHDAKVIEKAARRGTKLTSQLLGFARRGKHQQVPVDLHGTARDVVALLSHSLDKKIRIDLELRAHKSKVLGDPAQMQQVLLNLAINAQDAMHDGGVLKLTTDLVDLDEEQCQIDPDVTPGSYLRLVLTDTGCGIPKEEQARIFEPFYTTKGPDKGTGMGLAMVYGIVKNHGGIVHVSSEVGHGTSFEIHLPIATGERPESFADLAPVRVGQGRVLVVDDEQWVLEGVSSLLRRMGYKVLTASRPSEAIACYREQSAEIDVVLLDFMMPEMNGHECFLALKQINPQIRAILTTGYSIEGKVQQTLDAGVADFIQKPYRLDVLGEKLAALIGSVGSESDKEKRLEAPDR